jgi:hypothetical protein
VGRPLGEAEDLERADHGDVTQVGGASGTKEENCWNSKPAGSPYIRTAVRNGATRGWESRWGRRAAGMAVPEFSIMSAPGAPEAETVKESDAAGNCKKAPDEGAGFWINQEEKVDGRDGVGPGVGRPEPPAGDGGREGATGVVGREERGVPRGEESAEAECGVATPEEIGGERPVKDG